MAVLATAGLSVLLAASVGAAAAAPGATRADASEGVDVWVTVGVTTGTPGVVVRVPVSWGNHGPEAAGTVVLTYTPPKGATLATPLPQGWSATVAGGARWTATRLPAGGKARSAALPVRISVKAEVGKLTGGRATIGLGLVQAHTDNAPGNDTAASTITVKPVPTPISTPIPTPTPKPTPSRSPRPTPTPTPSRTARPTPTPSPTVSPTPSGTPRPTPSPSPRPAPTTSAVAVPAPGGPTPPGPTPIGSDVTDVNLPAPLSSVPDLDVVTAVLVPFGVVGAGCFLWMRRRLRD